MKGLPVTVRLLDPPLHEFLPHDASAMKAVAKEMGVTPAKLKARVDSLHEMNPMLGHRGCRLSITYPEILEMQCKRSWKPPLRVPRRRSRPSLRS